MQKSTIHYLTNEHLLLRFQSPRWIQRLIKILSAVFILFLVFFIWEFIAFQTFFSLISASVLLLFLSIKSMVFDRKQVVEITATHIYSQEFRSFRNKIISKRLFLQQIEKVKSNSTYHMLTFIAKDHSKLSMGPFRSKKQLNFIKNRCLRSNITKEYKKGAFQ